jgi:hypothetical protein
MKRIGCLIVLLLCLMACTNSSTKAPLKKYNCLLDKISDKDTMLLICASEGCFGSDERIIKIFKTDGFLYANYKESAGYRSSNLNNILSDSSITLYKQLEKEGKKFERKNGLCTSTSTYSIKIKSEGFQFIDTECRFNLYEKFLKQTVVFPNYNE